MDSCDGQDRICVESNTYFVRDAEIFERDPSTLNERTETPREQSDVLVDSMALDGLEGVSSAVFVIGLASVRHRQGVSDKVEVAQKTRGCCQSPTTRMNARKACLLQALRLPQDLADEVIMVLDTISFLTRMAGLHTRHLPAHLPCR